MSFLDLNITGKSEILSTFINDENLAIRLEIKRLCALANSTGMSGVREYYQQAYRKFQSLTQEHHGRLPEDLRVPFFEFLQDYATVHMRQGTVNEGGALKSELLLEMSLILQLQEIQLIDGSFDWYSDDNLEFLIKRFESGQYNKAVQEYIKSGNPWVLRQNISKHPLQKTLSQAFIKFREDLEKTEKFDLDFQSKLYQLIFRSTDNL